MEKIRKACLGRGVAGIKQMGRTFRLYDDDGNRKLTLDELKYGLQDYGVTMSDEEVQAVFDEFDKDNDGSVCFDEFLQKLRPPMSDYRKTHIEKAFKYMDRSGDGCITYEDLLGAYSVKEHPKYKSGEMTKKQVLDEFLNSFEPEPKYRDGKVTPEEFLSYYSAVSASIDRDVYWDYMMRQAWPQIFENSDRRVKGHSSFKM